MTTSLVEPQALAEQIEVSDNELLVHLEDGRTLIVPLAWFPRLLDASPEARANWQLLGRGEGSHWPDADEDLSVEGLLVGRKLVQPSPQDP
ncbi:MAG: DUF2442 domain-containing protein [Acidobacteriota bacterium]